VVADRASPCACRIPSDLIARRVGIHQDVSLSSEPPSSRQHSSDGYNRAMNLTLAFDDNLGYPNGLIEASNRLCRTPLTSR